MSVLQESSPATGHGGASASAPHGGTPGSRGMTQQGKGRRPGEVEAAPSLLLGARGGMGWEGRRQVCFFQYELGLTGSEGSPDVERRRLGLGGMRPLPA